MWDTNQSKNDFSLSFRLFAFLRPPQLEKMEKTLEKLKKSPWFGRDHVARSSSGLKPIRRRAPKDTNQLCFRHLKQHV